MKSQKEICFSIISSLRSEGKSDQDVVILGSIQLLDLWKKGEWTKSKGSNEESEILRYSRDLIKNWMKKDVRLNGGDKYVPKNPRGPRDQSPKSGSPDLQKVLDHLKSTNPNDPLIVEIEERIMWEMMDKSKVG